MRPGERAFARPTALASLAIAILLAVGCRHDSRKDSPRDFPNQAPGVRYMGSAACAPCHEEIAATFAHTGMGRSFYPMSRKVAVEDFTARNEIETSEAGLRYRMLEREGRYFMRQFVLDSRGREIGVDEREMLFVCGSGNHSRSYITAIADKLYQMPVCWYPETKIWDLCPGYEHKNDLFTREITSTCVFCHNGRMERVSGARNQYKAPIAAGIDCERCHGPGELHVARWSASKERPTGGLDSTIVNPRRLPPDRRIHVCFQCHLGDVKAGERVPRHDRQLEEFRPGFLLTDVSVPFEYEQVLESDFGLSAQADRLLRSRCFLASGGKIECLTCHNPHVTTYDKSRTPDFYRQKCLGCHEVRACEAPESDRQATSPRDDCVRCHMRRAEPDDHRHTAFTDHWIRKRIEPAGSHVRSSIAFAPVFPEAFASLPEAEQAFYRGRINLLKALETPPAVRSAMLDEATSSFQRAIREGFGKTDAWFFLGKSLGYQGRLDDSVKVLRDAHRRDPEHRDAALNLGQLLLQQGRIAEAAELFEGMLKKNGRDPGALAELGRCRLAADRKAEALDLYDRALEEEPYNARLQVNRAVVLFALQRLDEAAKAAEQAARLAPSKAAVWKACAEILKRANRPMEAAEAERRALSIARRGAEAPDRTSMD